MKGGRLRRHVEAVDQADAIPTSSVRIEARGRGEAGARKTNQDLLCLVVTVWRIGVPI